MTAALATTTTAPAPAGTTGDLATTADQQRRAVAALETLAPNTRRQYRS